MTGSPCFWRSGRIRSLRRRLLKRPRPAREGIVHLAAEGKPERESMLQACAGIYVSVQAPRWEV